MFWLGASTKPYAGFDVFDTLLTRAVGNPEDLYLLLGRRLLRTGRIACTAEIFARQRRDAQRRAFAKNDAHPTLADVCDELAQALELSADDALMLAQAEMRLEEQLTRPIGGAAALLHTSRSGGDSIVFITDTYFPATFVRDLLTVHGLWMPGDAIFASCECGVDKARGLLFAHVARTLHAREEAFTYYGNNPTADVRNGRLAGWRVRHLADANLNRYERELSADAWMTGGLSSIFAGSSRTARLAFPGATERERVLRAVAAGVMAPLLTAWMIWTLRRAVRDGCKRLYFMSRDGQVLLDVARRLEPILRTGLEFRYMYGSRQSVQCGGSAADVLRDLLRLRRCRMLDVVEALHLDPELILPFLPATFARRAQWTRNLSSAERAKLRDVLADERIRSVIQQKGADIRAILSAYLGQEGWNDGIPFGLVDVGWRCSIAGALSAMLASNPDGLPAHYYFFGLDRDAHVVAGTGNIPKLNAWFFDAASDRGFLPYLASTTSLVEMFCAADHGAVSSFGRAGDHVEPVFRAGESPMQTWGLPVLRETTAAFLDAFVATLKIDPDLIDLSVDARHSVSAVLKRFWLEPTPLEVRYWGTFPVETTRNNSVVLPLAEPVRFNQIVAALMARRLSIRSDHSWPRGTAMASALPYRLLLELTYWAKLQAPKLRRRFLWLTIRINDRLAHYARRSRR